MFEKLAGDSAEALGGVGDEKRVAGASALRRRLGVDDLPNAGRGRLRAVDDRNLVADDMLDRAAKNRIVRATENQRIDAGGESFRSV